MSDGDYNSVHAKRWEESLKWLDGVVPDKADVLELGDTSLFTEMFAQRFPTAVIYHVSGDLRHGIPRGWFRPKADLILCQELLEHISDADGKDIPTEWKGTGVNNLLRDCLEVLKEGGRIFITSPNASSATVVHHVLNHAPPMIFRQHVREYSVFELDEIVRNAGFAIERRECIDCWRNAISDAQHAAIMQFIKKAGYDPTLRGEDIFLLGRKPEKKGAPV